MDKKLEKALNEQIVKELYSAYIYLGMAAYFDAENLGGFAAWMKKQAQEEVEHGMKFYEFLNDRGCQVVFGSMDKPAVRYASPTEAFKKTLAHEKSVTESINALYDLAKKTHDTAAEIFLQWFITEQVEEEKNANDILAKLARIGNQAGPLMMLDKGLGERGKNHG